ncbi:hypothetical protein [Nocardioides sp.]|uniref:hypothetical protein n=1 Tax=Nocardioides sp. TaxID=35761 RepID=UPI002720D74A|nr:hypothetical protein [Nocardioides sp.]MDO9456575.1 hypothetical protein [Nocardioides sp.]
MSRRPSVVIDPPLEVAEIEFIAAFAMEAGSKGVRRVWPGQPSRRCPWRPTRDGQFLELDVAMATSDPDSVASWLRFLSREFLAPSTAASLDAALTQGLRGGHRLTGEVLVGADRRVAVELGRVTEETLPPPERDAVVLDMDTHRNGHPHGAGRQGRPGQTER